METQSKKPSNASNVSSVLPISLTELNSPWTLRGRLLEILPSIAKKEAKEIESKKMAQKRMSDKRNLYLLKEGVFKADSVEAKEMSQEDWTKRVKSTHQRAQQIKNLTNFVSKTRLSIRNLPLNMDEKKLKNTCFQSVLDYVKEHPESEKGNEKIKIKQTKIIRNKEGRKDTEGQLRSLGYGFIEFEHHEHALYALRKMNNHPTLFTQSRRPVVEFAIENSSIVQKRAQRTSSSSSSHLVNDSSNTSVDTAPKKNRQKKSSFSKKNKKFKRS